MTIANTVKLKDDKDIPYEPRKVSGWRFTTIEHSVDSETRVYTKKEKFKERLIITASNGHVNMKNSRTNSKTTKYCNKIMEENNFIDKSSDNFFLKYKRYVQLVIA